MCTILQAMDNVLFIPLENPEMEKLKQTVFRVQELGEEQQPLTEEVARAIELLWEDPAVKKAYEMRSEFQLTDSAKQYVLFFCLSIKRTSSVFWILLRGSPSRGTGRQYRISSSPGWPQLVSWKSSSKLRTSTLGESSESFSIVFSWGTLIRMLGFKYKE